MKKMLLPFALLLSFVAPPLAAQVMGNYQTQRNTAPVNYQANFRGVPRAATFAEDPSVVEITINALSNQGADGYVAIFSVYQSGETVQAVNEAMNGRIDAVKAGLTALGVAERDVYVDLVNFLPTYAFSEEKKIFSRKTLTEQPTGFNLQKNLHIRYRDAALLDRIMTTAAGAEIYDLIKVDYLVDEPQAVYNELRRLAFDYLDTLKTLYSARGVALDSAQQHVAESAWVVYPGDRYETYSAHASQQLTAKEREGAVVTKIEKPSLRFYNAIPMNDYDLVVNPELLEPAAQFSFGLKVRFTLPPKAPAVKTLRKNNYYYLTPDGKLVLLDPGQE